MHVVSVNVGLPRELRWKGKTVLSAIAKEPVAGRVAVRDGCVAGDGVADVGNHGVPDQAVYVYPHEHYAFWAETLGRDGFSFGQFGENLTLEGLTEEQACIGDQYRIGTTLFEVSQPRIPCFKQEMHIQAEGFVRQFQESRYVGYYFRIIEEGDIGAGDAVERFSRASAGISVRDIVEMRFFGGGDTVSLERAANLATLSSSWREALQKRLDKQCPGS